ncbi:MAG: histidinol-phosphatase [Spirochaetales bacterium]|nr:MAG: histidinol-phosphatase [Spirochaetales bacterium]
MSRFQADLHIHSCLSPCGDLSASPRAIARHAREAGLDMAALTDHNTARNAPAFADACRREGIVPLFGMEVTTSEEIHALTLFASAETALKAGDEIYEALDSGSFDPESFGDQVWVNSDEEIEGMLEKLLIIGTSNLSLDELGPWCRSRGGILIPAHIDRPAFGALGQLGFLPDGPFEGVECTIPLDRSITAPWTVTASSDAHFPEHVGQRRIVFEASRLNFDGLKEALASGKVEPVFKRG